MNQDERKKFWDVLLTMHDAAPEHIQQLQKTIIIPNTLCRFRAVNENSLVQLQENKLYFQLLITMMIHSIHIFILTMTRLIVKSKVLFLY